MSYPVAFLGTPDFAAAHLQALIDSPDFDVKVVVSQPDRPAGRKMKMQPSSVKSLALSTGLPVLTPESAKSEEFIGEIEKYQCEAAVVVAYGQILTEDFLTAFNHKVVNVHGSLLPRWRGAAPIQRSLMEGDKITGVSLQKMVKALDAGDVIGVREIDIRPEHDALVLLQIMSELGSDLLLNEFKDFLAGKIEPQAQDESQVTYAKKIEKSEAIIDWSLSSEQIWNRFRGLKMGPGSRSKINGMGVKFKAMRPENTQGGKPGEVLVAEGNDLVLACGEGALRIESLQPEARSALSVGEFLRGYPLKKGDCFGE